MDAWRNDKPTVAHVYDGLAGQYDREATALIHYHDAARTFLAENARAGRRVLDLGCGTGRLTAGLPLDVEVVGIDLSPAMLVQARRQRPSGTYIVHDFHEALPAGVGPFDAVVASGSFDFCEDPERVIGHVAAVLAPGGRFHFTLNERRGELPLHGARWLDATAGEADVRVFFWTFAETAAAIEAAGLRPVTYAHAPGWENAFLQTTIHCGYWVVERPRGDGQAVR